MTCITKLLPNGWRFYIADASIAGRVSVMLTRNESQRKLWNKLPEFEMDRICLYVNGSGHDFTEALADAIRQTLSVPLLEDAK